MLDYPVHFSVQAPARFTRLQLAVRVVAFIAVGALGVSCGAVFLFAYLALPAFAASRLASGRDPDIYVREDGPRIVAGLKWLAAISAWAGLVVEKLPVKSPSETLTLAVSADAHPTAKSALLRVLFGLPSALVLGLLCWLGAFVWLWAAVTVLFTERVGASTHHYLVGLQRWGMRLLVYQASLVDEYPPYSFGDSPPKVFASHFTAS